jgi:hypothetical protein
MHQNYKALTFVAAEPARKNAASNTKKTPQG